MLTRLLAAPITAIVLHAGVAYADPTAYATVSVVQIQLVDLDLTDGVTPTISFTDTPSPYYPAYVSAYGYSGVLPITVGQIGADLTTTAIGPGYTTTASITGGNPYAADSWGGSASAIGTGLIGYANAQARLAFGPFSLSPNTQLTITGIASTSITTPSSGDTAAAIAYASITVNGITVFDENYKFVTQLGAYAEAGDSVLTTAWINNSKSVVIGSIQYGIDASVSVVPDAPSSLLLGLGLLCLAARRQIAACGSWFMRRHTAAA